MAFNIFATATSDIPLANLDANFTMIGSSAVASTLYPTASTSITYGTAGTSHIFSGSIGAFTLSGTVAGGGNQLNNVVIGTTTPLAGAFTTLSATGTLSGGTSGTGYSFSGSAAAGSLTLDSSGNLGLGVTPSAWSVSGILQSGRTALSGGANAVGSSLSWNAYYNAGWKYYDSLQAAQYTQSNGVHTWYTAPSGTAGNAITFTQSLAVGKGTTLALEGATSATGTGIAFPATQSASSNANTLDDYEEGTWTATLIGGTTAPTVPVTATGNYTKIGRQVTVTVDFSNVSTVGASGIILVTGLPYTTAGTTYGSLGFSGFGLVSGISFMPNGVTYMLPVEQISLNNINILASTNKYLSFTASYFTS
jgi:hypothetical protein